MPTVIYIDDHAKKILEKVKILLKEKGMQGQSYGDAVRYLFSLAKENIVNEFAKFNIKVNEKLEEVSK